MICCPTGVNMDCFVVDLDPPNGMKAFKALRVEAGADHVDTYTVKTQSGGYHLYYKLPPDRDIRNSASKIGANIDIRGEGGYIILPPSEGKNGRYELHSDVAPILPPGWLIEQIFRQKVRPSINKIQSSLAGGTTYGLTAKESELAKVALAQEGRRNHTLNESAFSLGQLVAGGELDESTTRNELCNAALRCGLSESEINKTIASGFKAGMNEPRTPLLARNGRL